MCNLFTKKAKMFQKKSSNTFIIKSDEPIINESQSQFGGIKSFFAEIHSGDEGMVGEIVQAVVYESAAKAYSLVDYWPESALVTVKGQYKIASDPKYKNKIVIREIVTQEGDEIDTAANVTPAASDMPNDDIPF